MYKSDPLTKSEKRWVGWGILLAVITIGIFIGLIFLLHEIEDNGLQTATIVFASVAFVVGLFGVRGFANQQGREAAAKNSEYHPQYYRLNNENDLRKLDPRA